MQTNFNDIRVLLSEKMGKVLFDVLVVLLLPVLFALGYYFWSGDDDSALLSLVVEKQDGQEYGAKAKDALARLRSITMDASLFEDPVYQSLQEFHVDIDMSIPLGRTYPFTPPDVLRGKARPVQVTPAR
ncbi:MAG: hypothetical protein Q7S52_06040 [bacterium]|nr:hypothetical protein [bacterium]